MAVMKEFKGEKQKKRVCSFLDLTRHCQEPALQLLNQWNTRQVIRIAGKLASTSMTDEFFDSLKERELITNKIGRQTLANSAATGAFKYSHFI
jgi:hypothetical protein